MEATRLTNEEALQCQLSLVHLGLLEDEFIDSFANQPHHHHRRKHLKPPLINRGTFLRTRAIDSTCRMFLERFAVGADSAPARRVQIVSLGAGYDTRFFRLLRDFQSSWNAAYFEVDLDTVIEVKRSIIEATPKLKEAALRGNLHILAADLNDPEHLPKHLSLLPQFDPSAPTLVLVECLLMYLAKDSGDWLLRYWATVPGPAVHRELVLFDPILKDDRFGKQMLENLRNWGVDDVAFQAYPTAEAVIERFVRCGFAQEATRCWSMLQLESSEDTVHLVPLPERRLLQQKAALDEYEEWFLMAQHYIFLHATLPGQ